MAGADGKTDTAHSTERLMIFRMTVAGAVKLAEAALPATFTGMAWSPDGRRLAVSLGFVDALALFSWDGTSLRPDGGWVPLGHRAGNGLRVKPTAAGVAWSDSTHVLVANFMNDSVSLVDVAARRSVAEADLRPGIVDAAQRGRAGGTYPFSDRDGRTRPGRRLGPARPRAGDAAGRPERAGGRGAGDDRGATDGAARAARRTCSGRRRQHRHADRARRRRRECRRISRRRASRDRARAADGAQSECAGAVGRAAVDDAGRLERGRGDRPARDAGAAERPAGAAGRIDSDRLVSRRGRGGRRPGGDRQLQGAGRTQSRRMPVDALDHERDRMPAIGALRPAGADRLAAHPAAACAQGARRADRAGAGQCRRAFAPGGSARRGGDDGGAAAGAQRHLHRQGKPHLRPAARRPAAGRR